MYFKRILLTILFFFFSSCEIIEVIDYNRDMVEYNIDILDTNPDTATLYLNIYNDIPGLNIDIDTCWLYNIYLLDKELGSAIFNTDHYILSTDSSVTFTPIHLIPQHTSLWDPLIDPYNKTYIKMHMCMTIYGEILYNGYVYTPIYEILVPGNNYYNISRDIVKSWYIKSDHGYINILKDIKFDASVTQWNDTVVVVK